MRLMIDHLKMVLYKNEPILSIYYVMLKIISGKYNIILVI
jgi:hypothetical protein